MSTRMYFAADGNYGSEKGMSVVTITDGWSDEFWNVIEMVSDEDRPAFAFDYAMYVGSDRGAVARVSMIKSIEIAGLDYEDAKGIL